MIQLVSSQRVEETSPVDDYVKSDDCSKSAKVDGVNLHRDGTSPIDYDHESTQS
jgi:hypothetical protein